MFKESPSQGTNLEFEYLRELEAEFKKNEGVNQGPYGVDFEKKSETKNLVLLSF